MENSMRLEKNRYPVQKASIPEIEIYSAKLESCNIANQ